MSSSQRQTAHALLAAQGIARLSELRDASLRIAATPTIVQASAGAAPSRTAPGTPWPWFVAWLLLAAATWSLERSRMGLRVAAGT